MGWPDRDYARSAPQAEVSSFAAKVYGWMAVGLALTAVVAYMVYTSGIYQALLPYWWVLGIATFAIAMVISTQIQRLQVPTLALLFLAYAFLEGVFFGTLLPNYAAAYGGGVIWSAFATAALLFSVALLYGVCTKADLTKIGKILTFAVIGLIAVTLLYVIISLFHPMPWMNLIISYLGLIIFVGLTAWDAQQIRNMSYQAQGNNLLAYKLALVMALRMYINVIMVFWYLLQIFSSGGRR